MEGKAKNEGIFEKSYGRKYSLESCYGPKSTLKKHA